MNTELPDAAVQKLTAQIGTALFGQPGLDLIEIANRCNAEASRRGGALLNELSGNSGELSDARAQFEVWAKGRNLTRDKWGVSAYVDSYVDDDWEVWQAAFASMQPSPAGQEDALVTDAMVEAAHAAYWAHPDDSGEDRPCIRAALEAAIAARQPVEIPDALIRDVFLRNGFKVKDGQSDLKPYVFAAARELLAVAARQPVGQEPVGDGWSGWATQYPGKMPKLYGAREIAEVNHHPEEGQRLIFLSEQPAQAVDLGLLTRWSIQSAECSCCEGDSEPLQDSEGNWVAFADVKALIDSGKAVQS